MCTCPKHLSICLSRRDIQVCTKYSAKSLVYQCSNMKMKQNKSKMKQIYPQIAKLYKKASKLFLNLPVSMFQCPKHLSICLTRRDIQVCTKYSAMSLVYQCSNMNMKRNKSKMNQIYP